MPPYRILALAMLLGLAAPAQGQTADVPYWASIRTDKARMRVGPSDNYQIEWIYIRRNLPLRVVRMQEGWRLVEDPEGTRGWIAAPLLSRLRTAIVTGDQPADLRAAGGPSAALRWRVEPGVVGTLGECAEGWCAFEVDKHGGWIRQARLWGAGAP